VVSAGGPRARAGLDAGRVAGLGAGLGLLVLAAAGCSAPDPPRLVAMPGCGIDEGLIDNLLVKARGDFPGGGTELRLSGGEQSLAWGERPVEGVTVEGLFGQALEAVGRTARLREEGDLPVYFARVDGLCPVTDSAAPRQSVAAALGEEGDVVVVGGRGVQGSLRDDVLHFHDETGELTRLPGSLPAALVGHSVHAVGARQFLVVGGASADAVVHGEVVVIDLDDEADPIGTPQSWPSSSTLSSARAFHAAGQDLAGRILVAGGCRRVLEDVECDIEDDPHLGPGVHDGSMWIESDGTALSVYEGPPLVVPRYGASLMFAPDGAAFLAGGWDATGAPVHVIERLRPGNTRFRRYGGELGDALGTSAIVGATLLGGGIVVLVLDDGRVYWVTEHGREEIRAWPGWCDGTGPCFSEATATVRGAMALPGERVVIDGMILPALGVALTGSAVHDPFAVGPRNPTPPPRRVGARPVLLDDGSVLLVGGRHSDSGSLATPVALRLRPALDGPDEGIPDFDRSLAGSLIAHDPERVLLEGETLQLIAGIDDGSPFPSTRMHARGFRSSSFRFEVTLQVGSGEVVPYLVLEHGGLEAMSVALEPERIQAHVRDPQGREVSVSCASRGLDFSDRAQVLRFDVSPGSIEVRQGSQSVAQCPGLSDQPWSVGIGASGAGDLRVTGLRLTRQ